MMAESTDRVGRATRSMQFSLRAVLIGIAIISLWLGWYVSSANQQRKAVRTILQRGGTVLYDYQYDAQRDRPLPSGNPTRPVWLRHLLDDHYFHHVVSVGLDEAVPTDADLVHLEKLPHLRALYLGGGQITDAGLERLAHLRDLRMLFLWQNPISGEGLKHLQGLGNLRFLDLSQTKVSDENLAHLRNFQRLERLDLPNNPQLSGSFLQYVADLPSLKGLVLRGTGVTDTALVHLKRAKGLQSLMLDNTKVTQAARARLEDLTNLRNLQLPASSLSRPAAN